MRTYDNVERGLRIQRNDLEAHVIQVLDKPRQIFALQARNNISIPFAAKEIAEVLVELRRSFVEVVELL